MEMRTMRKTVCLVLLAGPALAAGAARRAQDLPEPGDGFTWEQVGDVPIDALDLAFGPDSTLWASAPSGPYCLDTTQGFPGTWVLAGDERSLRALLPLGRGPSGDTLLANTGSTTKRSVDGGQTWEEVYDEGDEGLYEKIGRA